MELVYSVKGVAGLFEVFDNKVDLTPRGLLGILNKGVVGTKTIPFNSITGVQLRMGNALTNGYIQFTLPGGNESKGGILAAQKDENSFTFQAKQNGLMVEIQNYIEQRIGKPSGSSDSSGSISIADELRKLAELKDQGVLSEEEFQTAKRKLIT